MPEPTPRALKAVPKNVRKESVGRRFQNDYTCLEHFNASVLVNCPRCQECAQLVPNVSKLRMPEGPDRRQVACRHCGYSSEFKSATLDRACVTADWHHRLPLWLQIPCCGEVLWAFNEEHLSFLQRFIGAGLRERTGDGRHSNHSMTSRLPQWMQAAKHRDEVLRGLERLRARLPASANALHSPNGGFP